MVAVIHGEDQLARAATTSDVDIVSEVPAPDLMRRASAGWHEMGLHPVMLWPYDVGGTGSIFLCTPAAEEGIQIDVLHDPKGAGRYGFRSAAMLEHIVAGDRFPTLRDEVRRTYLARKRMIKGQAERLQEIVANGGVSFPLAGELLSARAASDLNSALETGAYPRIRQRALQPVRWVTRLVNPIGAWVHVQGSGGNDPRTDAFALAERFARFLPHVDVQHLASPIRRPTWWFNSVAPLRWRPGLFVSHSSHDQAPRLPDLLVTDSRGEMDACRRVVEALELRLLV